MSNHQGSGSDTRVLAAVAQGLPVIDGVREFLVAARCLLSHRDFLALPAQPHLPVLDPIRLAQWREVLSSGQARSALDGLRMRKLLDETRGRPTLAIDKFCDMASRLSMLAIALLDCIDEVDINPVRLMVDDCIGLDALVVPREAHEVKI